MLEISKIPTTTKRFSYMLRAVLRDVDGSIVSVWETSFIAGTPVHHGLEYLKSFIFVGELRES